MAQRKDPQTQREPDALIISKSEFSNKLKERIISGEVIFARSITNVSELEENKADYYKWDDYNEELLKNSFNNENNSYRESYRNVNMSWISVSGHSSPSEKLAELKKDIRKKIEELKMLLEKIDLLKSKVENPVSNTVITALEIKHSDNSNIFLVHGHNNDILQTVARTIEKLGLNPIILNEQANLGRTIIEKFEAHSEVGFAIVLLTNDDEGKSKTSIELQQRARQNVILELGYFIGKLGRSKVLPLYSEGVELPSDIHGVLYTLLDGGGNWKFAIVRELSQVGYKVDANKLL